MSFIDVFLKFLIVLLLCSVCLLQIRLCLKILFSQVLLGLNELVNAGDILLLLRAFKLIMLVHIGMSLGLLWIPLRASYILKSVRLRYCLPRCNNENLAVHYMAVQNILVVWGSVFFLSLGYWNIIFSWWRTQFLKLKRTLTGQLLHAMIVPRGDDYY